MIGLVIKDMLVMRKTLRSYILFLIFYAGLAVLGVFHFSTVTAMLQVILMMLPIGAFSYDEQAKWDRCALTLPLSRRAVVGARYLFTLFLALSAASFGLVTCVLLSILSTAQTMAENLATILLALGVGLFIADILLPLCYKLGPERARPYLYAVVFLPMLVFFGAFKLGLLDGLELTDTAAFVWCALTPLLTLAGLGLSFLISCRILERKEVS